MMGPRQRQQARRQRRHPGPDLMRRRRRSHFRGSRRLSIERMQGPPSHHAAWRPSPRRRWPRPGCSRRSARVAACERSPRWNQLSPQLLESKPSRQPSMTPPLAPSAVSLEASAVPSEAPSEASAVPSEALAEALAVPLGDAGPLARVPWLLVSAWGAQQLVSASGAPVAPSLAAHPTEGARRRRSQWTCRRTRP